MVVVVVVVLVVGGKSYLIVKREQLILTSGNSLSSLVQAESSALPPAPGGKVPALDHDEHPHQHRPSSRASQSLA